MVRTERANVHIRCVWGSHVGLGIGWTTLPRAGCGGLHRSARRRAVIVSKAELRLANTPRSAEPPRSVVLEVFYAPTIHFDIP